MGLWDRSAGGLRYLSVPDPLAGVPNPIDNIPAEMGPLPFPAVDLHKLDAAVAHALKDLIKACTAAGLAPAATAILASFCGHLEQQAHGRLKQLPYPLRGWLQPQFGFDVSDVWYAQNVNTIHGRPMSVDNHIYYPRAVDPDNVDQVTAPGDGLLHELEHCQQYWVTGGWGKSPFFAKYVSPAAGAVMHGKSFNVHDNAELEEAAIGRAKQLGPEIGRLVASPRVALKAHHDQYLSAQGGGGRELVVNSWRLETWETFRLVDLGEGRVALSAANGQFVSAEGGGGREVTACRDRIRDWETFQLTELGRHQIALQAHNGQYLCAEGGGGREVTANRSEIDEWETFELVPAERVLGAGQYYDALGRGEETEDSEGGPII